MLTRLQFTNFKSWPKVDLACGRITGIFGTNSSGKTSLIQFLLMLKQTKNATDPAISLELNGDLVQLGTIKDAIHRHDETKTIDIDASFTLKTNITLNDPGGRNIKAIANGYDLRIATQVAALPKGPTATRLEYSLGGMSFKLAPKNGDQYKFDLTTIAGVGHQTQFNFIRTQGRAWQLPGPVKSYRFPDQARAYFQNSGFLGDLEAAYEAELDGVFYLGPLRDFPKRDYLWARSRPSDVGLRGEKAIDAILAATDAKETRNLKTKARSKPFQEMIAHWLKEMGLIESFKVEEIAKGSNRWQAKLMTRAGAAEVLLTDVGFGVSQVLPVVTLLQYVPENSIVILEQPEIHLHPLAQAALADVIIQAAVHRRVQVILESHSEHLLLRLQRRIAEEVISQDDLRLYFCDAPGGTSTLIPLDVDMFGSIRNWPEKFMGDQFGEIAAAELTRIDRKRRGSAK
jgi:predicted ATPase